MGFDPRAAVTEALRNGVGMGNEIGTGAATGGHWQLSVEPPPTNKEKQSSRPAHPRSAGGDGSARGGDVPGHAEPRPAPQRTVGVRRGRRRVLDLNLGRAARAVIEEDHSGRTRTEIVLQAIEATYDQIVAAHSRQRGGLFAAAGRPAERRRVDEARKVVVTVSEAEAEILAEVLARTTLSLSGFVDEALRRMGSAGDR
jgi:hypothetical protein